MLGHEQSCLNDIVALGFSRFSTSKLGVALFILLRALIMFRMGLFPFVEASQRLNRSLKRLRLKAKDFAMTTNMQLNPRAQCENRSRKSFSCKVLNYEKNWSVCCPYLGNLLRFFALVLENKAESEVLTSQAATSLTRERYSASICSETQCGF